MILFLILQLILEWLVFKAKLCLNQACVFLYYSFNLSYEHFPPANLHYLTLSFD